MNVTHIHLDELPEAHQNILLECEAEAYRNMEQGDALTEADVASDIIRRLTTLYPEAS